MKNAYLLLCLIFCFSNSFAQLAYGVKAGLHYSHTASNTITLSADGNRSSKYQSASVPVMRPLVGVWTSLPVSRQLSLLTNLQLIQKSWLNNHEDFIAQIDYELYYFSLPVQVSYSINRWDFHFGPELNYLFHTEDQNDFGSFKIGPSSVELGLTAGLSYHFSRWFLNFRASRDMTPLFKFKINNIFTGTSDDFAVYNQGLQLSLGYRLSTNNRRAY